MSIPLDKIYSYFKANKFPTQQQFEDSWSSFWHKDEVIIPVNTATVDDYDESGNISKLGNVYTKNQSNDMFMSYGDYTDNNGNILAEKIEALGLTTLIEAVETTISNFADHSGSYKFEDNDFIAIPDSSGNFSLYLFKGGAKTDKTNYLPTGISNVTIGMVEGLQAALNTKMNKPSGNGNFFIKGLDSGPTYAPISPIANYLLSWDGNDFKESNVYYNTGKLGVGTTNPMEQLHLTGRLRSKGILLDENDEVLKNQITCYNKGFYAADSTGVKKKILMKEDLGYEFLQLPDQLSDENKTNWKTKMNGGWSTGTMSAAMISPPIVDQTKNQPSWITLKGANLNLNPTSFSVELFNIETNIYISIPSRQVQLYTTGLDLVFWFNFNTVPAGNYRIRLWNGVAYYTTPMVLKSLSNLTEFDMTSIVWTALKADGSLTSGSYGNNGFGTIAPGGVWTALRSSILFKQDEDFSLSFKINSQLPISSQTNYAGIISGLIPISTVNNFSIEWKYLDYSSWGGAGNVMLNGNLAGNGNTNFTDTVYITRQGTLYSIMVVKGDGAVHYFNITAPAVPVTLGLLGVVGTETLTIQQIYSLNQ